MRRAAKQLDGDTVRGLRIQRKEKRPNEPLVAVPHVGCRFNASTLQNAVYHLPIQNWLKTESRICSTSTTPMTSPTARNAISRSIATYSDDTCWLRAVRARSHDSKARRRQSR